MLHIIRRGLHGCATRLKQRDAIRSLRRLDDRMLADIGIQRSQIQSVVRDHKFNNYL
jgi:uncharacterized protein YjiS (DUF1127 family)